MRHPFPNGSAGEEEKREEKMNYLEFRKKLWEKDKTLGFVGKEGNAIALFPPTMEAKEEKDWKEEKKIIDNAIKKYHEQKMKSVKTSYMPNLYFLCNLVFKEAHSRGTQLGREEEKKKRFSRTMKDMGEILKAERLKVKQKAIREIDEWIIRHFPVRLEDIDKKNKNLRLNVSPILIDELKSRIQKSG